LEQTFLYRCFDAEGALLYVGISCQALIRFSQHQSAEWSDRVAKITIKKYPDRRSASAAELEAIKSEKPLHNIADGTFPRRRLKSKMSIREILAAKTPPLKPSSEARPSFMDMLRALEAEKASKRAAKATARRIAKLNFPLCAL
jgi:predicted GIY-YIG superfamily endonuclease